MTWKNAGACLLALTVAAILVAPVLVYISHFGMAISSSHARWAEMGSAMAGIYGPVIAGLTLLMLFRQTRIMATATELQSHTAALLAAQDQRARMQEDINSRWERLNQHLERISSRVGHIRSHLDRLEALNLNTFWLMANAGFSTRSAKEKAADAYKSDPGLLDSWTGIAAALSGIIEQPYEDESLQRQRVLAFEQMRLHVAATLSVPVTSTLDALQYALDGRCPRYFNNEFSTIPEYEASRQTL